MKINAFSTIKALDRTFAMTLSISITSFGLASIRITIAILWNTTKLLKKQKAKVVLIPMGGLRGWVRVAAESTRRVRTTEVFILRTSKPLIHFFGILALLIVFGNHKSQVQFPVNVY